MNNKNQVALHYKFPELHSRNQFFIFVYTMTPKSLLIVSFYYYCLKKALYLQNYPKFIHLSGWTERKSSIHWTADKHLQHLQQFQPQWLWTRKPAPKFFFFAERSLFHLSYWPCSTIYIKAKCDDMRDTRVHCHWSPLTTFYVLKIDNCSFEKILKVITNQVCFG